MTNGHTPEAAGETSARAADISLNLGAAGPGIDIEFVSQQFAGSVDWSFAGPVHKVLIWRRGDAAFKEVEFECGPAGYVTPRTSNVWIIPAGQRSAGMARRASCAFAELTIPPSVIGEAILRPVVNRRDPLLHNLVERIASTRGRTDQVGRLLRESLADALRLHVLDRYGEQPSIPRRAVRVLDQVMQQRLIDFLRDSLDDEIDLPTLARLVDMPVTGFRRAFTRTFNTTPYQYVLDQRIEKSKVLLSTTAMAITEISVASGFSSPSHFATTFKQRAGVTPTTYRHGA
ncbi:AraC family transcriptional regulator [Mycobacteroides abscessus]|uniref:AraC family transcriptional regulator n=1 Tax=Mycobacteroides abscessus TaxID=36809 RepID=UPI0011A9F9C5|nr:AraC family transcriptional regulator [Mycobacteroides abscessus]